MARLPLPPAETIKLRSLAELSRGGMGTIDLARAEGGRRDGQLFAVKRLHERYAKDPQFVAMFLDEAWMTAALKNPNVVQVAAWGTDDDGMFLAVELVEGVSLHGLLRAARQRKDAIPERTVAFLGSEICAGLAAAHDLRGTDGAPLGLVHRDLTASNVLVSFRGDVKIADFGIAKARARITHTETGMLKGKPGCMAPEQARGQEMDHRADIFSFGVLMFELLAGRRPWIADTPIELMLEAAQDPPPDLTKLRRGCDPTLAAIINKCLEKDPKHRHQSALGVKALLDEWRAEKGFVGGERAALAKFVLRNCEPQVEWFKRALAGDFAKGTGTTFKDLEEQAGDTSGISAPRRSRPNTPLVAEMAEGGEPLEPPPPSAPVLSPNVSRPSGPARFSFVARWASTQPEREKEGASPPTAIPKPVLPAKEEPPPPAPRPPPATKLRASQETLKSNEVIPDLLRAISGAQAPIQRPPKKPPPTVRVTSATTPAATDTNQSNSKGISSDSGAESPTAPTMPRDGPAGALGSPFDAQPATPRDASVSDPVSPTPSPAQPATPRDASMAAPRNAPVTPQKSAALEAPPAPSEPLSVDSMPTPPPAPPPPVPLVEDSAPVLAPPPRAEPPRPALVSAQIVAANQGKAAPVAITSKAPDDDIDAGPQPTMKSPLVSSSVAPAPQPPVDVRVSVPAPLPPQPPTPPAPITPPRPAKRRTDPGRTRISTTPAKPPANARTQPSALSPPPRKTNEARSAVLIAVVALFVGAIVAWLLRDHF